MSVIIYTLIFYDQIFKIIDTRLKITTDTNKV